MKTNDVYDIIIQAGQSNAEGMGRGDVPSEYVPNPNVLYLNVEKKVEHKPEAVVVTYYDKPFQISIAQERHVAGATIGDFSLPFARKYVESGLLEKNRKLLIVRAGIGGTGFKKGNWGVKDQLYIKMSEMIDYALSLNKENRVVGFLWHQGEHDAFEKNEPEIFEKQLFEMFTAIRENYGDMPIIAGDFVSEWKQKNIDLCEPIVDKIKTVLKRLGKTAFIETQDLLSNNQKIGNNDDIHFCRDALYELGERYFNQYVVIKNGSL